MTYGASQQTPMLLCFLSHLILIAEHWITICNYTVRWLYALVNEKEQELCSCDVAKWVTFTGTCGFSHISVILKVLDDSRQILVTANMQPDDPFPMDDKIKEGLVTFAPLSVTLPTPFFFSSISSMSFTLCLHHLWPACLVLHHALFLILS